MEIRSEGIGTGRGGGDPDAPGVDAGPARRHVPAWGPGGALENAPLDRLYSGFDGSIGAINPDGRERPSSARTLIVGINPSGDRVVKKNSALHRLSYWVEYLRLNGEHHFTNVITVPGDYNQKMVDVDRLRDIGHKYDKVIALGSFPSEALRRAGIEHFVMPHPSPRNRQLNDAGYEQKMLSECYNYLWREHANHHKGP